MSYIGHIRGRVHLLRAGLYLTAAFLAVLPVHGYSQDSRPISVYASETLRLVLEDLGPLYEARTQTPIEVFYSKSSDLARRIASGAPVDLFVTGDIEWATWLQAQGFVRAEDRLIFAIDRLVMIAPENSPVEPVPAVELLLSEWRNSEELLGLADPERNGAGLRARNVLTAFQDIVGPLDALEDRLALAEDRAVLKRLVKRGELGLAITYLTEAKSADGVKVVARFDPADHQPILAVAARTKLGNAEADSFLAFLGSPEAQTVLMRAGFETP